MADRIPLLTKLRKAFNISFNTNKKQGIGKVDILPGEIDPETGKIKPVKFTSDIQKLWEWWLYQVSDNADSLKNRLERYKDLDYMYYNAPVISSAIELYADETVQYDSQNEPLIVNAKDKKVVQHIEEMFKRAGINQQSLREIARNLSLYGDAYTINSMEDKLGYTDALVVDVTTIKERIEFNAVDAQKKLMKFRGYDNFAAKDYRLQQLSKMLKDTESKKSSDASVLFKSYLFGYQIEDDMYLAPWNVSHYRLYSSKSEFYPYGRPLLINAISPFRQLQASKNLMAMARAAKFPKEHYEVETDIRMTQAEKWSAINEARQEFLNLSKDQGAKEDFAVGGAVWTPKGLISYNLLENKMNLDDIADVEFLRDEIVMTTKVPKGYLIIDRQGWGASSQALLQQYKPFGRSVLQIQQAILRELIQMVKIDFIISGKFDSDTEFELSMNFPVIEDASDRLTLKSTTLGLAKEIITSLAQTLGVNGKLPTDVVKDIFGKFSFLGFDDLEGWIDKITKDNAKLSEEENNKLNRISEKLLRETYFECKKKMNLQEGLQSGRHYMTSWSKEAVNEQVLDLLKLPNTGQKQRI